MNDKVFDNKMKAALGNLEVPYEAGSWAALEQRLNAPFAEEHPVPVDAVDKAVFRTLERLEAPFQPAHWEMLARRVATAVRLRRRVWAAKLSEAVIFLLLLLNLDGLTGGNDVSPTNPTAPAPPSKNHLQAGVAAPPVRQNAGHAEQNRAAENAYTNYGLSWSTMPDNLFPLVDNQIFEETIAPLENEKEGILFPENSSVPASGDWATFDALNFLPLLPRQPVERVNASPYAGSVVSARTPKQHRFYAVTVANFDKNYVRSEDYAHSSQGYGGGVAIGYRIGKWGVEAGLSYNRKQYQPKKEVEIYGGSTVNGFYGSFAKQVDADMVSVPVKITRRIAQFGQMSALAVAGVTTNIAVDKSYHYGTNFYPGQGPPNSANDPDQQPQLRKTGKGVLENGSFAGNVYASADAGIRLEHPVGRRFVAFVEPAYRHAFGDKGVGPKPAKINTLSVQAGVMAAL